MQAAPEYKTKAKMQFYVVTWEKKPFKIGRVYFGSKRVIFAMAKVAQDCVFTCCKNHIGETFARAATEAQYHYFEDKWHGIAIMQRLVTLQDHRIMIEIMRKIAVAHSHDPWFNTSTGRCNIFCVTKSS